MHVLNDLWCTAAQKIVDEAPKSCVQHGLHGLSCYIPIVFAYAECWFSHDAAQLLSDVIG